MNNHIPTVVPVASGAGRIKCSCGWMSRVSDDGDMYKPDYYSSTEQKADFEKHLTDTSNDKPVSDDYITETIARIMPWDDYFDWWIKQTPGMKTECFNPLRDASSCFSVMKAISKFDGGYLINLQNTDDDQWRCTIHRGNRIFVAESIDKSMLRAITMSAYKLALTLKVSN